MTSYALVNMATGKVKTFVRPDLPTGYTPPEGYQLVPDDQLPAGWQREDSRAATAAEIAAHRYAVENGGVAVAVSTGTHRFDTTRENRSMWLALQLGAHANPSLTQGWKTLDHGFVVLTNADILAVTDAVYAHVTDCFAAEAALLASPPALPDLPAAFATAYGSSH